MFFRKLDCPNPTPPSFIIIILHRLICFSKYKRFSNYRHDCRYLHHIWRWLCKEIRLLCNGFAIAFATCLVWSLYLTTISLISRTVSKVLPLPNFVLSQATLGNNGSYSWPLTSFHCNKLLLSIFVSVSVLVSGFRLFLDFKYQKLFGKVWRIGEVWPALQRMG